jgi:four helix bundle protein
MEFLGRGRNSVSMSQPEPTPCGRTGPPPAPAPVPGRSAPGADLSSRTRAFAVAIIRFHSELPRTAEAQVIARQLLRSGTSVGAHYREATRARSDAEFISKLEGGLQELEETRYWIELLRDADIIPWPRLVDLDAEADQLTAIFVTIARNRKAQSRRGPRRP